jgi:predicted DNA-binding protein (MmcQ/YjbR family)
VADPGASFRRLCLELPETAEKEAWGHPTFRVGAVGAAAAKMFASMAVDGSTATLKADPDERPALLADEERYFLPPYVGSKGWVGLHLAHPSTDWDEVAELVRTSYVLVAPKRLSKQLDGGTGATGGR